MEAKTRVFIVCANRLLRESLARILGKKPGLEIVATQAVGSTSPEEILDSGAHVVVLDSLEFLLGNSRSSPETGSLARSLSFILVSMEDDHSRFLTAVRRGARGYVLQNASASDVVAAIRTVAEGEAVCPPGYARVLFDFVATQTDELPNSRKRAKWGLTRREQQVIPFLDHGLTNKEIAGHLGLSEQTVKNHIHRILRKVGVSDRLSIVEAVRDQTVFPRSHQTEHSD